MVQSKGMEISLGGAGATGPEYASALRAMERLGVSASSSHHPGGSTAADSVDPLLRELNQTDLARLAGILDLAASAPAYELLQAVVQLAAQPDPGPALQQLHGLMQSEPLLAEAVVSEPGLA